MAKENIINNSFLTEIDPAFQTVSQMVRKFISTAVSTSSSQKLMPYFADNAFIFTKFSEKVVVTREGIDQFLTSNLQAIKGLKLVTEIANLNVLRATSGIFEVVANISLVDAKTRNPVLFANLSMTLWESPSLKIVNFGYVTTLAGRTSQIDPNSVARIDEIMTYLSSQLPFGLIRIDKTPTTNFNYANGAFFNILGISPSEYEELYLNDLFARIDIADVNTLKNGLSSVIYDNIPLDCEIRFYDKTNQLKYIELRSISSDIVDEPSLLLVAVDRTRENQIFELIKTTDNAVNNSLKAKSQLFFHYDIRSDTMEFDVATMAKLGVEEMMSNAIQTLFDREIISYDGFFDLQNLIGKVSRGEPSAQTILKIKSLAGTYEYCIVSLSKELSVNDSSVTLGIITPMNAQRELELFEIQTAFNSSLVLTENEMLASFDVETGNFDSVLNHFATTKTNDAFSNFYEQSEFTKEDKIHADHKEKYHAFVQKDNIKKLYASGQTSFHFEHMRTFNGVDYIYMDLIFGIMKSSTNGKLIANIFLKNIDEQKRLQIIYQYKSEHDELTKLYNRDTAKKIMSDFLANSTNGMLHCCFLIDLTNLKDINEISGHVFGDQLIESFSDKLKAMFGNGALLSRYTGNQFLLFLPNIPSKEYATEKAKQLVEFFNNSAMRDPKLFSSTGIAFFPFDGKTFDDLYFATDQALTEAKKLANRQSNYLRTEDITQARLDREALNQADRFGTAGNTGMAFESVNKRGAFQYFAKTNLKYWSITAFITIAVILLIGSLEVVFADEFAAFFVNQKLAIFLVPFFTFVLLVTVSIIYFTSKRQIKKILYVDKVTLGNSKMLFDETGESYVRRSGDHYAFVYSNIVNFKLLNERFGSNSGDSVLRNLYQIISSCLDKYEVCGRISNDKFGILVKYGNAQSEVIDKIKRISRLANRIADDQGLTFGVTLKFGIYFIENNKENFSHFSNRAELALSKAVASDKEIFHIYDSNLKSKLIREKELEGKMQDALFNNNFKVFLQPKVSTTKGTVIGAEALVRWIDHGNLIMPSEFISIFEENGFITQLDLYMFQEVCKALKEWETLNKRIVPISVNISKKSLSMHNFVQLYKRIMDKYKIDKRFIEFEITESMMVDDFDRLATIINKIHSMGCSCSIDDFGTGFSSLSVLKNINVDAIKIDRSFFLVSKNDFAEQKRARAVVTGIVYIAKSLGMLVVAEGVEDKEQISFLNSIGCDHIQSFAYYRPLPLKEFERLIS